MTPIDEIDRELIRHLQANGRTSYSQLGQLVGLSDGAARQRVNRLTAEGVIDIVAVTDPVKLGLGFQAMIGITVSSDARKIAVELDTFHDCVYVVMTAGRFDLMVEVVCRDRETFVELSNTIRMVAGVETVELMPYLGITKQTYDWGVG